MKYIFSIFFLVAAIVSASAQQFVKTQIKEVTVYLQGAELVHEGAMVLPSGKSTVVFESLSANMQPESVVL
ncbi:MAG: DUF4140 domain-containing protein, partial [Bacteroidota bacterium]